MAMGGMGGMHMGGMHMGGMPMGMPMGGMPMGGMPMGCSGGMPMGGMPMGGSAYGAIPTNTSGGDRSSPYGATASTSVPSASTSSLPAGWESAQDPSSGKMYYFNRSSGETKWDPPGGAPAANPAPAQAAAAPA